MIQRLPREGAVFVAILGLVFVLSGVSFWFQSLLPVAASTHSALFELVMHVLFGSVILLLGIHIERSELLPEERREVIAWCFSGFLFFLVLAFWSELGALLSGSLTREFVSNVVVFGSMGGAFGAISGVNRGRATRNASLAARAEEQRETLEMLARLLRHDIRNDMQIIEAHADFLEESVPADGVSSLTMIQQTSDAIIRLLEDSATLIETLGSERELRPISLSQVVDQELSKIRENHPELTIDTNVPSDIRVTADGLIHQLFSNLLTNAVAHNDPEDLTIHIEATTEGDRVNVVVRDDGTGIPNEMQENCFDLGEKGPDSTGDGLGLYLVSRLADVYGGSVELGDSPDWGAEFNITLLPAGSGK